MKKQNYVKALHYMLSLSAF